MTVVMYDAVYFGTSVGKESAVSIFKV